jgi:hypothetical protein
VTIIKKTHYLMIKKYVSTYYKSNNNINSRVTSDRGNCEMPLKLENTPHFIESKGMLSA